jgi:hypothetical protein
LIAAARPAPTALDGLFSVSATAQRQAKWRPVFSEFAAYFVGTTLGEIMGITVSTTKSSTNRWSLHAHDLCIVSAFGIWSAILGLSPVLVFYAFVPN